MQYKYKSITFTITESKAFEGYYIHCIDDIDNYEVKEYIYDLNSFISFMLIHFEEIEHNEVVDIYNCLQELRR